MDKQELPALPVVGWFAQWNSVYEIERDRDSLEHPERGEALVMQADARDALTAQSAEIDRLRDALLHCARLAEALKLPCGDDDPESPQAIRNGQYQNISLTAHITLGTIRGPAAPSEADEIARLTAEVERLRKDAERLDWMQRTENTPWRVTHMHGSPRTDGSGGHYWREVFDGWAANSTGDNPLPTIREAIDAAMKEKTNEHR